LALERCRRGFVVAEVGLRRNVAPAAVDDMATVAGDRDGGCGLWVGGSLGWEVMVNSVSGVILFAVTEFLAKGSRAFACL
jgi:hypothetical protein